MKARAAKAEARRLTTAIRRSPPRNAPDLTKQLDAADAALDRAGADPALPGERSHDPIGSLEALVKRLKQDASMLTALGDLIASLDGIAQGALSPGRAQARDVLAPATHSGQVREARTEAPSRPE